MSQTSFPFNDLAPELQSMVYREFIYLCCEKPLVSCPNEGLDSPMEILCRPMLSFGELLPLFHSSKDAAAAVRSELIRMKALDIFTVKIKGLMQLGFVAATFPTEEWPKLKGDFEINRHTAAGIRVIKPSLVQLFRFTRGGIRGGISPQMGAWGLTLRTIGDCHFLGSQTPENDKDILTQFYKLDSINLHLISHRNAKGNRHRIKLIINGDLGKFRLFTDIMPLMNWERFYTRMNMAASASALPDNQQLIDSAAAWQR